MTEPCFIQSLVPNSSAASNINVGTGVGSILACHVQGTAFLKAAAPLLLNGTYSPKRDANMEAYKRSEDIKIRHQPSFYKVFKLLSQKKSRVEHEQDFLRSRRWKDAATRFQLAKFRPQSAILDITLGASGITDIFLTFLTDKKSA